jgi:hypothetical protein
LTAAAAGTAFVTASTHASVAGLPPAVAGEILPLAGQVAAVALAASVKAPFGRTETEQLAPLELASVGAFFSGRHTFAGVAKVSVIRFLSSSGSGQQCTPQGKLSLPTMPE